MNLKMLSALTDRIINANLDAVAFVPGPNFRCLFGRDFHLMAVSYTHLTLPTILLV